MAKRKKKKAKEPMSPLKKYLFIMGAITATITTGMAVQPVGEFIFTFEIRKEFNDLKLKQFSDNKLIKNDLKTIKDTLESFTSNRDKQLVALALEAFKKEQDKLARAE